MLVDTYLENSNIPRRYLSDIKLRPCQSDEQSFMELNTIKLNIKDFVAQGNNLLIYSAHTGNGKTTWATKILVEYIKSVGRVSFRDNCPGLFINVSNFLNKKKLAITDSSLAEEVKSIEKRILSANLVVFDDLGVKDISAYEMNSLYYWIDDRTSNLKSCIFTSNLSPQILETVLDPRVYSRVINYSILKEITGGDNRVSTSTNYK